MKFRKNQAGFTGIEVLLVLIFLAIIGFTGYYVYHAQKTTNNKSSTSAAANKTQSSSDSTSAPTQKTSATKYLKIAELGIELPLSSQISDLAYSGYLQDSYNGVVTKHVILNSGSVLGNLYHQIDPDCIAEAYPVLPGYLTTSAPGVNQTAGATVTVGSTTYYLYAKGGAAPCDDPTNKFNFNPTAAQQAQIDAYKTAAYAAVTNAKAIQ